MNEGTRARIILVVVATMMTVVLLAGLVGAGAASESAPETDDPTEPTITTTQQSDNLSQQIRNALPDSVLAELPEGFLEQLLAGAGDQLSGDVSEQLDQLDQIPDALLESVLLDMINSIPDEVLQNPQQYLENPPDAIPAILVRADDMAEKADPGGRENWGPTNVNAQIGNQNLTVALSELGTVTVFKYPSPSYADQVKHHAFDRREPYYGTDPNAGAFLGLAYETESGDQNFDWIRDWGPVSTMNPDHAEHVNMSWHSDTSDTLVTEFTNESLGLTVTVTDAIPKDEDVFIRDINVTATDDSPVTDVEVASYANFNLVDWKNALIPTRDWADESKNDAAVTYDEDTDSIVYEKPEWDPDLPAEMYERAGPEFSIATAMSFDGPSSQHHIAGDAYMGNSSDDPFTLLSNGTTDLPGNDSHTGQVSTVLTRDIDFEGGSGHARVYFGAASEEEPQLKIGDQAVAKIEAVEERSFEDIVAEKEEWFERYVEHAPMPKGAPENVTKLAKRSLISVVQIWDPYTENQFGFSGNTIAAVPTQAPYGADWIRDGAYFNYAIDRFLGTNGTGQHDWVNQHNHWYKSLQQNRGGECPAHCNDNMRYYDLGLGIIPEDPVLRDLAFDQLPFMSTVHRGGWAMNYYADGVPAGPLGGEVDETAYGAWTFWDHYVQTENETYLQDLYPAIKLVGDRLTYDCVDEETGLQCARPEDDNEEYTETGVGALSVYAGLDSAAKAASEMYQITGNVSYAEDAQAYGERRAELRGAIDEHLWNETTQRGIGGRSAMPAFYRPLDDPRMQQQLQNMWENVNQTFSDEKDAGQYEAKNLIGLGVAAAELEEDPIALEQLRDGVEWLATEAARSGSTHIMGEAWVRETWVDGDVDAAVSQPHVWQQLLTYMASTLAYGNNSIAQSDRVGYDEYREWRHNDPNVTSVEISETTVGQPLEATVTVTNDAPVAQSYHLTYELTGPDGSEYNGTAADTAEIPAGETDTLTLSWNATDAPTGEYEATVTAWKAAAVNENGEPDAELFAQDPTALADPDDRNVALDETTASASITQQDPATFAVSNLDPSEGNVTVDETVTVSATVTNEGEMTGEATVEFRLDGETQANRSVSLAGGEETSVTFEFNASGVEPGEYAHSIAVVRDGADEDEASGTLTVEEGDTDGGGAGFTVVAAALALLGVLAVTLFVRRD